METATRFGERQGGIASVLSSPSSEITRNLSATATYLLSEQGRKASLLAGGNGHAVQEIALQVPANRLHLVSVDRHGVARLKLRPRFETNDDRIVRIDAAPLYDAPPTIDELYRAAAKNHEFENAFYTERTAQRSKRTDAEREVRESVAQAFIADKGQRAVSHPPPTPKHCSILTERGRMQFNIETDQGLAKDVPAEAHRRFRADLRERNEQNRRHRAAQLVLHEEKKQFIAEWIATNGTHEQQIRQAAGMLPMDEAINGITGQVFACNDRLPRYAHDGAQRLQRWLQQCGASDDSLVTPSDVVVRSVNAVKATADQWAAIQELRNTVPDAKVVLREHILSSKRHQELPPLTIFGALVTKRGTDPSCSDVSTFLARRRERNRLSKTGCV
jgi:hypothetical protein